MKVILDTDIGSDIDDAVCLAYLLAQPACELLGITTVSGEAVLRAQMARSMCRTAGKPEIPVYPGVELPLMIEQKQPRAPQAAVLSKEEKEERFPRGKAVDFLRMTIRENPGEVHLLTIGPLTNIGLLFGLDPEIPGLLGGLTAMAGVFMKKTRADHPGEWNVLCDPHAAAIAFARAPKMTRLIGLDVTTRVAMSADEVRRRFDTPLLERVVEFAEVWFEKAERITFHDPLAASVIFNDGICGYREGGVRVELGEDRIPGATPFEPGAGSIRIADSVKEDRFFEEYFSVFA